MTHSSSKPIAIWLLCTAFTVALMAVIGAITRLTQSGLSMVEWQPLVGVLPPMHEAEWQRVFGLYQATPEYQLKNMGMDLAGFKQIFFWEWLHRTWGHVVGAVYLLPFLFFYFTKRAPAHLLHRLLGIFALGGLQGFMGWFMVASGLVDRPDVSHYRLALHLGLAFIIFSALWLTALQILDPRTKEYADKGLKKHGTAALHLLAITIIWGAFVAGLDAGFAYNTWPLMNDQFLPSEAFTLSPLLHNFSENTAMVQWLHRWLAVATFITIISYAWRIRKVSEGAMLLLIGATMLQVSLGIMALLLAVPVWAGTLHQMGALVLLASLLYVRRLLRRKPH